MPHVEVPMLHNMCHRVEVCACQQKQSVLHAFQRCRRLLDFDLFGGIKLSCLGLAVSF